MTETFIRIAAGHYRNVGTGVEIVRVSADEAGQRGWHVTAPMRSGFEVVAIGATMREVKDAYVSAVRTMCAAIEAAREEAMDYEAFIEQEIDEDEAWAASDTTWRQTTEQAHAEALALDEARSARNAENSWAERIWAFALAQGWSGPTGYVRAEKWLIAKDRDEARGMDAERINAIAEQGDTEDDDLIHFWVGDRTPSACGVDIWTTPYTFGSPVLAEVTCETCKGREQHRQFVARVGALDEFHDEALAEDSRRRVDTSPECSPECLMPRAAGADQSHLADCPAKVYLVAKQDAARIIAGARAPQGSTGPGVPEVPADLDDDAAWAAYCTALPPATDQEIADVLAEYGDPYAGPRAEVVDGFKAAARMVWKMRTRQRIAGSPLDDDIIAFLRSQMRILRGVIETYDMLTESWRVSVRAGADRDAATQTF
jgi:hypothetical protein